MTKIPENVHRFFGQNNWDFHHSFHFFLQIIPVLALGSLSSRIRNLVSSIQGVFCVKCSFVPFALSKQTCVK